MKTTKAFGKTLGQEKEHMKEALHARRHKNARLCGSEFQLLLQKLSFILEEGKNMSLRQQSELLWLKKTKTCILSVAQIF